LLKGLGKEMQFTYVLNSPNGAMLTTLYSKENQVLIAGSFNIGHESLSLYHEIKEGPNAGLILQHILNFKTRTVTIIGENNKGYGKLRIVLLTPTRENGFDKSKL
jgi:hypothetical protein